MIQMPSTTFCFSFCRCFNSYWVKLLTLFAQKSQKIKFINRLKWTVKTMDLFLFLVLVCLQGLSPVKYSLFPFLFLFFSPLLLQTFFVLIGCAIWPSFNLKCTSIPVCILGGKVGFADLGQRRHGIWPFDPSSAATQWMLRTICQYLKGLSEAHQYEPSWVNMTAAQTGGRQVIFSLQMPCSCSFAGDHHNSDLLRPVWWIYMQAWAWHNVYTYFWTGAILYPVSS